jgi:hypothetical protein
MGLRPFVTPGPGRSEQEESVHVQTKEYFEGFGARIAPRVGLRSGCLWRHDSIDSKQVMSPRYDIHLIPLYAYGR